MAQGDFKDNASHWIFTQHYVKDFHKLIGRTTYVVDLQFVQVRFTQYPHIFPIVKMRAGESFGLQIYNNDF